jgi:SAM-dependent methyltransferase
MTTHSNDDQIEYWNARAGEIWAVFQDQLDRQLAPLGQAAMDALEIKSGEQILDIGCGCGGTALELARRVGDAGAVTGLDISRPMLEVARARTAPRGAAQPVFIRADAQVTALGCVDAVFSRFGMMFFNDPLAAFKNIRAALKPGGRLGFVCWRSFDLNIWMRAPLEVAKEFLPETASVDPTAPGPFAFADAQRLRGILGEAGFGEISIVEFDASIGGSGVEESVKLAMQVGPLGRALSEHPEILDHIEAPLRAKLSEFLTPRGVMMPAACWIVIARG